MEINWDFFVTIIVLLTIAYMIYTRLKQQTLRDTWDELRELFSRGEE